MCCFYLRLCSNWSFIDSHSEIKLLGGLILFLGKFRKENLKFTQIFVFLTLFSYINYKEEHFGRWLKFNFDYLSNFSTVKNVRASGVICIPGANWLFVVSMNILEKLRHFHTLGILTIISWWKIVPNHFANSLKEHRRFASRAHITLDSITLCSYHWIQFEILIQF